MKSLFVGLWRSSFFKYALVGGLGLVVDMGLFYLFYQRLGINYVVANVMSSSLAVVHNFLWNSFFTFRVRNRLWSRFLLFYGVALAGMGLSSAMLALMIDVLHWNGMVAKGISVFVVAMLQYFINKKLTFGEKRLFSRRSTPQKKS
jgi:putative flippase GtrA